MSLTKKVLSGQMDRARVTYLPEIFFQENLIMVSFFRWTQWIFNIHQKWSEIWFMFGSVHGQSNSPKTSHNWLNVKWMVSHYVKILKGKEEIPKFQNELFSCLFSPNINFSQILFLNSNNEDYLLGPTLVWTKNYLNEIPQELWMQGRYSNIIRYVM